MGTDFKEVDRRFGSDEATRRSAGNSTLIRRTFCLPGFAQCWREAAIRLCLVVAGPSGLLTVVVFSDHVAAQTPITSDGPPQQVIPQVSEVGMPNFTIPSGMTPPSAGSAGGDSEGSGTGEGENGAGSGSLGSNDALNTMMNQPWGITAINNAEAVGVNPTALAATCVLESGCQNIGSSGSSNATGAFQMMPATYSAMISAALAQNPGLASSIVPGAAGMNDPATQSIAASEYLLQGAQNLQNAGVADPNVLDVRGYYNFGPKYGAALALAPDNAPIAEVLSGEPTTALAQNGITAGETVGQWKQSVAAKIGNAANQSVLL